MPLDCKSLITKKTLHTKVYVHGHLLNCIAVYGNGLTWLNFLFKYNISQQSATTVLDLKHKVGYRWRVHLRHGGRCKAAVHIRTQTLVMISV